MKRLLLALCCIVAIVGIVVAAVYAIDVFTHDASAHGISIEISGTPVDNDYNNYISEYDAVNPTGDLVRIGNKLYFNYFGNYKTYGLYEITSEGAQRIYWNGYDPWAFLVGYSYTIYPIREYDGMLLMNTKLDQVQYVYNEQTKEKELKEGVIQTYCEESKIFEKATLYGGVSDIHALTYQQTSFGFVYESFERGALWVYTEETGAKQILSEHLHSFYTSEEQIYYITHAHPGEPFILHMFDWKLQTDTVICQWSEYNSMSYFFIEGNDLVFLASDSAKNTRSLYKLDLNNTGKKETILYTTDKNDPDSPHISSWNVWNGTAYLCTDSGLIACDLETGAHRLLCAKAVLECDIVDDMWVYFLDADSHFFWESDSHFLWRVPQSGGEAELVFGGQ